MSTSNRQRFRDEAEAAARRAGVVVRTITTPDGFAEVRRLFDETWSGNPTNPTVTAELLRALSKAGAYIAGAYGGRALIGATVGFFGPPDERALHSHVTGVSAGAQGRSVGLALKLFQRVWALERGVSVVLWTFDPLVRRNAYFNIVKLGAKPVEYLPNFYGAMHDQINRDGESDRLLVRWELDESTPVTRSVDVSDAEVVLARTDSSVPLSFERTSRVVLAEVPEDIEALRRSDAVNADAWRRALREVLETRMAAGGSVVGFDEQGRYVVDMGEAGFHR